jgi:hypothetical protein
MCSAALAGPVLDVPVYHFCARSIRSSLRRAPCLHLWISPSTPWPCRQHPPLHLHAAAAPPPALPLCGCSTRPAASPASPPRSSPRPLVMLGRPLPPSGLSPIPWPAVVRAAGCHFPAHAAGRSARLPQGRGGWAPLIKVRMPHVQKILPINKKISPTLSNHFQKYKGMQCSNRQNFSNRVFFTITRC